MEFDFSVEILQEFEVKKESLMAEAILIEN